MMNDVRPIDANAALAHVDEDIAKVKASIEGKAPYYVGAQMMYIAGEVKESIKAYLDAAPTLDYAPVGHGEWIEKIEPYTYTAAGREIHIFHCSVCDFKWANKRMVFDHFKHCPNCGAKMDGGKKDDAP